MAKANNIKLKETEAVVVGPETGQQTIRIQNQSLLSSTASNTHHQSNFILVRAARSDSGQLILQNGHELLTLLNENALSHATGQDSDSSKPIVLQHPRLKARNTDSTNSIAVQPISIKNNSSDTPSTSAGQTILLQSGTTVKKGTLTSDGSIILQQTRLTATKTGSGNDTSGPILLQTLKRLDKTPSILVIRNAGSTATATVVPTTSKTVQTKTLTRVTQHHHHSHHQQEMIVTEGRERSVERASKQTNVPLGSGKYIFMIVLSIFLYFYSILLFLNFQQERMLKYDITEKNSWNKLKF